MPKEKKDADMQAFAQDVLTSIQQARRGEGPVHQVTLSAAAEARAKVGLTQSAFAQLMGVSVRTFRRVSPMRKMLGLPPRLQSSAHTTHSGMGWMHTLQGLGERLAVQGGRLPG